MMNFELSIHNPQFTIALGATLFLLGIAHLLPGIALLDAGIFRVLHKNLRPGNRFFQVIWHLGRTPFTLLCLAGFIIFNLQSGIFTAIVFAAAATLEWSIKRTFQRPRPYTLIPDAEMGQPRQPKDTSFPSGDAMRIWFLALIIPWIFGISSIYTLGACLIALLVTIGRIAMGVHFPLDTLAGTGIGLVAAGIIQQLVITN
jgi:membrane-associated phospholipid phosphatase